jgi:hypothetical protein
MVSCSVNGMVHGLDGPQMIVLSCKEILGGSSMSSKRVEQLALEVHSESAVTAT